MATIPSIFEAKKDFSKELQELIPESISVASTVGLDDAINLLLGFEKKCRLNNDFNTLKEVCLHTIRLIREKNEWEKLNSIITLISKRRAQSKVAISAIVEESFGYIESTPSLEVKIELIKVLKDICEGKIYVEGESAKLHLMLARILEGKGDINQACEMIQDVHVETYGSLSKKEKAEYILEQIRLNLLNKDFIRALIQSRKMNRKVLEEADFDQVKTKFYEMMIEYHTHDFDAWEISQCYYKIFDTPSTRADAALLTYALEGCVVFLAAARVDNHRADMLHRLRALKDLERFPVLSGFLGLFTAKEIIPTPFPDQELLEAHPSLRKVGGETVAARFVEALRKRVVEHNLRVIASYYRRITIQRLSQLLDIEENLLETYLSELAGSGDAYLKIDRPAGIVRFGAPKPPAEVLSDWASDVGKMLALMESTCHLVNRENMVHKLV